jgi:para-nitrobenzyl esterase
LASCAEAPQTSENWKGVNQQSLVRDLSRALFGDMNSRSDGLSEDCLYLNIWSPAGTDKKALPVLVYFYGGGFLAGDGSEPRYDGASMAKKGIVVVTVNYRLGLFAFFST